MPEIGVEISLAEIYAGAAFPSEGDGIPDER